MLAREATTLKLDLPPHVLAILDSWASSELEESPATVLEVLVEELCSNEELRTFAAGLLRNE
ncbi:MAG TPA: hypothetical protein VNT27_15125 [Propionibacteriaceae bacterium]|nr:hypothetical protein [Propionibacteriaceae bacterium]